MPSLRLMALIIIGGLITIGVLADQEPRRFEILDAPVSLATPVSTEQTWFCPGGSGLGGLATVGLELINPSTEVASAEVTTLRSDSEAASSTDVEIEPRSRMTVALADLATGSDWVGAIVEVTGADVIVEQTYEGETGTDRAACPTQTTTSLIVTNGATRQLANGEQMVMLLMNPFQEAAVADIQFDSDVGTDSLDAVVVPARRVVAIDVTTEVTIASRVSAIVTVRSGRLVGNRVQVRANDNQRGLTVTPAVHQGSLVSVLPNASRLDGVVDTVHVINPSASEIAEVDLEIVTDGSVVVDPIELTVRPRRTVVVDLSTEARLDKLSGFGIVVRSLSGLPVGAGLTRFVATATDAIPGTAGTPAFDAAATTWFAALDGEESEIAVLNPSSTAIATVTVSSITDVGTVVITEFELGPSRRQTVSSAAIDHDRPLLLIEATAPVVVGREIIGFTSRQLPGAVAAEGVVPVGEDS